MTDPVPLSKEQRRVVEAPADGRQLVIAPAGTGKTHTLIARLVYLIKHCGVSPGRGVLVLSFSRAAVREIRNRVHAEGGDVAHVRALTFDSFATRLLAEVEPKGKWGEQGYDGRIAAAVEAIHDQAEAREMLDDYEHLLVDELQDVVGVRDALVRALLENTGGGFTAFGDPAQAIFNHHLEGEARRLGSTVLFRWIRERFDGQLVERELTKNYRAESPLAKRAFAAASAELAKGEPDFEKARGNLESIIDELSLLPSLDQLHLMQGSNERKTAVLCRTNGQALVISRNLWRLGVRHRLQRLATDRAIAPWLARSLSDVRAGSLGRSAYLDLYGDNVGRDGPEPEEAWELLHRTVGRGKSDLDLRLVNDRVRVGNVPDELTDLVPAPIVVSTIHRAKGLEFDTVVVVEGDPWEDDAEGAFEEETRVLQVALTRPRRELFKVEEPRTRGRLFKNRSDRWVRRGFQRWERWGFEVRPDDAHRDEPAGGFMVDVDAAKTQELLWRDVRSGDAVSLELIRASTGRGEPRAFYSINHERGTLGVTSESFGTALYWELRVNRFWEVRWPPSISDLFIEGVDSVAGTPAAGKRSGLGDSGLWLRARIVGLGNLHWEKRTGE